ncbi:MAG: hypothetical protein MUQ56_06270 [Thermoleophilia bacterium]|nr:hypothetical protein [Thermoleophilia bacterium]
MNSCCCSVDVDNDAPAFSRITDRRARKPHVCCECHEEIAVGDIYEDASGLWDGDFSRYKTCAICVLIREDLCPCGYYYGDLRETIMKCLGFDYVGDPSEWPEEAA